MLKKLRSQIEKFCIRHKLLITSNMETLYIEKNLLNMLLAGKEVKVYEMDSSVRIGKTLYIPYIVQYKNDKELEWWEQAYPVCSAYRKNSAIIELINYYRKNKE